MTTPLHLRLWMEAHQPTVSSAMRQLLLEASKALSPAPGFELKLVCLMCRTACEVPPCRRCAEMLTKGARSDGDDGGSPEV